MFPLQGGNDLVIQFSNSPTSTQQQHKISDDILMLDDYAFPHVSDSDKKFGNARRKKPFHGSDKKLDNSKEYKKKMIHREIERQRRQEMATLYASLRSLLPLEYIKGKRSISDHMNEAVNYINQLQKNIKELGAKRDELKKISNFNLENHESQPITRSFTVHENNGAVAIEITSDFREEKLSLSVLLQLLLDEGLEVISCLSTQVNGRILHSVQCEVNNSNSVDLAQLRSKVAYMISSFRCSCYD